MRSVRLFARGFNYSQDGPGNRLVYHLCGCNMRCPWCANPEGLDPDREGADVREVPVPALLEEIRSCAPMFYDGGGVTFTGGEATMQLDALCEIAAALQKDGIGVAVETNATHPRLPALFPYLQLLIADLKHPDSETLARFTGVRGETVYENLRRAAQAGVPLLVRIPAVHGFNDGKEDAALIAAFLRELNALRPAGAERIRAELLPYHEYGRDKWEKLGLPYRVTDGFVAPERIRALEDTLREAGVSVIHT